MAALASHVPLDKVPTQRKRHAKLALLGLLIAQSAQLLILALNVLQASLEMLVQVISQDVLLAQHLIKDPTQQEILVKLVMFHAQSVVIRLFVQLVLLLVTSQTQVSLANVVLVLPTVIRVLMLIPVPIAKLDIT
jgi:hypothetical protein